MLTKLSNTTGAALILTLLVGTALLQPVAAKDKKQKDVEPDDPFAEYVWPPAPAEP